jgi:hypothetical protein
MSIAAIAGNSAPQPTFDEQATHHTVPVENNVLDFTPSDQNANPE